MLSRDSSRAQQAPARRRRGAAGGSFKHVCKHCERTFKRSEHLERHVRTHTKEKPFICHCGSAFTRRDLLTRHQRIASHSASTEALKDVPPDASPETTAESDVATAAAAASLSDMSANHWVQQSQYIDNQPFAAHQDVPISTFDQRLLSQDIFGQGEGVANFDHFREFANFLDGVGLPAEWSPYFNESDLSNGVVDPALRQSRTGTATPTAARGTRSGTPFNSWLPSAPEKSCLPQNLPVAGPREVASEFPSFRVSEEQRSQLDAHLSTFQHVLISDFKLPSRHTLTRYITSYFEGFHLHLPFIHVYTWRLSDCPLELVLAIATVGAQYCFEHRMSENLFHAGKAVLMERLTRELKRFGPKTTAFITLHKYSSQNRTSDDSGDQSQKTNAWDPVDTVRALTILMAYATWEPKESQVREAFALQGLLVQILRDIGLDEEEEHASRDLNDLSPHAAWSIWLAYESTRRTKLIAFTFLHTHSVAYNTYPVLRSNELRLRLPCSTSEWKAASPGQWLAARREINKEQLDCQVALALLLRNSEGTAPLDPIPTPLGNYVLLHGLLQRIHIVRDLSLPIMDQSASLPNEEVSKLERALRSWTTGWQQAPESTLDPKNENGPIPFTSSSLLGLAYVRIYLNLGPYRQLESRDPALVARSLCRSPAVKRSDGVISALLYAAHALSIPVRLGIDRVARSQAFFWSVRHSLSGLECAVLLSKWLHELNDTIHATPLSDSEDRILHWVRCIVEEAYAVVDFDDGNHSKSQRDPLSLSRAVLEIWAYFFKSNTQWKFINIIGFSLEKYRELLVRSAR